VRQHAVFVWEYQADPQTDRWAPMTPSLSLAIEEEERRRVAARQPPAAAGFVAGAYLFFLGQPPHQISRSTGRRRPIRRSRAPLNEWEAVYETNGEQRGEIARLRASHQAAAAEAQRLQTALDQSELRGNALAAASGRREREAGELAGRRERLLARLQAVIGRYRRRTAEQAQRLRASARERREQGRRMGGLERQAAALVRAVEHASRLARDTDALARRNADALAQRNAALEAERAAAAESARRLGLQAAVQLQVHAERRGEGAPTGSRLFVCPAPGSGPAAAAGGRVPAGFPSDAFRECVVRLFLDSRAEHKESLHSTQVCPKPELEVLRVEGALNPKLAALFRACVADGRGELGPAWEHAMAARRVAQPDEAMRAPAVFVAGDDGLDGATLLGFHGAGDDVVQKIVEDGPDPYMSGKGAGSMFGPGLYYAANSSKADLYAGPRDRRFRRHEGEMSVVLALLFCGNMHTDLRPRGHAAAWPSPTPQQQRDCGISR
jgi:hypothetical protein